jgi:hypothetical protein
MTHSDGYEAIERDAKQMTVICDSALLCVLEGKLATVRSRCEVLRRVLAQMEACEQRLLERMHPPS